MDIDALLAKAMEHVSAGRSYGPVIERDDCTVIPAAYVVSAGGGGGGDGPDAEGRTGSGAGAGHWSMSWPIGAYVVRNGEARWVPAVDATRIAIGAFALAKLIVKVRAARRE